METKICSKCKIEKILNDFRLDITKKDGLRSDCKDCVKKYELQKRINNPNMIKEKLSKFYEKNPEKRKEYRKNYKVRKNEQKKERRKNDPTFVIINNIRSRLYKYLKKLTLTKRNKTFDIVGITPQELKGHLEKQFISGMTWENRNEWHIDHIIPLSSAKTEEELYKLCHYTNLQPLWAEDNIKKSNKIVEQFNNKKSD
jgi:hypothetical protein